MTGIWMRRIAWSALALGAFSAPAMAQQPSPDETNCIYDNLSDDDLFTVTEDFFAPDADTTKAADAAFAKVRPICSSKYNWTKNQGDAAESIALNGAIVDTLLSMMGTDPNKNSDSVHKVWSGLSAEDQNRFVNDDWFKDKAFKQSITAKLVGAGLENDKDVIEDALTVLESSALASDVADRWPKD
jgi:hypothetical protein